MNLKKDQNKPTWSRNKHKKRQSIIMKMCKLEFCSTKMVTIIYINTTFSSIVFIAYQTSANKTSHCHCFWNLSNNHKILYNIVSFQSSPDIQNCIYQLCTRSVFNFDFTTFIWPNTQSISALESGIGYIICVVQNQSVFLMGFLQWHLHASILQFNMPLCQ